jgi:hypothetical protein
VLLGAAAMLGAALAAARAGTFVHEAGGHLGVARLLGGRPAWLQVELMGGGGAWSEWPAPPGRAVERAVALGGIAAQLAAGAIALALLRARAPGGAADLFGRAFAALALVGGLHYLVVGSYYAVGDPAEEPWLWRPGIALAAPLSALALRPLGSWSAARIAGEGAGRARRLGCFLAAAALATAGYGALFFALHADYAALGARRVAAVRADAEARASKRAAVVAARAQVARDLEARGEPVPDAVRVPPAEDDVALAPVEVPRPPPIELPLAACYLVAAFAAGLAPARPAREIAPRDALLSLSLGVLAVAAVAPLARGVSL